MKLFIKTTIICLVILSSSCSKFTCDNFPDDNRQPDCDNCRILFIGSSYLNYAGNNVVEIFSEFCKAANREVIIEASMFGGFRLHRHLEYKPTIDKINSLGWDYVVLQGNSAYISKEKWHKYIIPRLEDLREIIKYNYDKTSVIYMMPWAYLDGLTFVEGETDNYDDMQLNIYNYSTKVATDIDIALAPAGWAWYQTRQKKYKAPLYLSDKNHQTISGAFLTAAVFYSTIFQEKAPYIEYTLTADDDESFLRETAYTIVIDDLDLWNIY